MQSRHISDIIFQTLKRRLDVTYYSFAFEHVQVVKYLLTIIKSALSTHVERNLNIHHTWVSWLPLLPW